jgi:hypothetical protein
VLAQPARCALRVRHGGGYESWVSLFVADACATPRDDADAELILLTQCLNDNGGQKERCGQAVEAVNACHRRRKATLQVLESNCGEAQSAYESCMEGGGAAGGDRGVCIGKLKAFLACAEVATAQQQQQQQQAH